MDLHKDVIKQLPNNLELKDAASVCDGVLTSWNFLMEMANIQPGQEVLVNGASGALGVAGVQIAKNAGAVVTAVCSAGNHVLVRSLGADRGIDYKTEDFIRILTE